MPDEFDYSMERYYDWVDNQVELQRRKGSDKIRSHVGRCYNCDAETDGLFCDSECREDYERRERCRSHHPQN